MRCKEQIATSNFLNFCSNNHAGPLNNEKEGIFGGTETKMMFMDEELSLMKSCGCYLNSRNNSIWPTGSNIFPSNFGRPSLPK